MAKPYDTRLIMMVAQVPFEVDINQFCKLLPVVYVDGTEAAETDFPNDGEIWWMLTARTAQLAQPGRLVVGMLEDALRYDEYDSTSSRYQAKLESVQDIDLKDGMEILTVPSDAIDNIQDVISGGFRLELPAWPATTMLRWRSHVYGPFTAASEAYDAARTRQNFTFAPASKDLTVYHLEESVFEEATRGRRAAVADDVSLTPHRRSESYRVVHVKHEVLLGSGYERVLASNPPKLVLEPIERKLLRYAKQILVRKKRQALRQLLEELEVTGRETQEAEDLVKAVSRIRSVTERQNAALDAVASALLESGLLGEDRLSRAEQTYAERYVQERTAELQAKVEESLTGRREELRRVEADLKDVRGRLQEEETQLRAALEQELGVEREKARQALAAEREEFDKQKAELQRQRDVLQQNLEKVTKDLREAGDDVVNRFLTIAPLLGSLGLVGEHRPCEERPATAPRAEEAPAAAFEMPAFIRGAAAAAGDALSEEALFERLRQVVEDSGFTYRPLDLQRFHLSVKCGELTVLGGPSGTGKSSLPALYAQALLGDEAGARPGCLMVNINPSWMDIRDLLGHMNTLEGRFYPAESGLFEHLVYAEEEHRARGASTGLYLACLDEMNLSQVEHYFSDFMMVLERGGPSRAMQCFSTEVARPHCPFRNHGRVALSPALRFVGTVNFDETTRLLSDRFLDRVNLIRLSSAVLPAVAGAGRGALATATGRMATLADFETWRTDSALPSELGSLLDEMRPLLSQMGCPVSPRVYRAICRFVGSAPPVLTATEAFDVQVAQRIAPKVRSLVTKRQLDALDGLLGLLTGSSACPFDETIPLLEDVRETAGTRGWDLEE